jgi:hypothetical protein
MTEHIKFFDNEIEKRLKQVPRAVQGAPKEVTYKLIRDIYILKDAKEIFTKLDTKTEDSKEFYCFDVTVQIAEETGGPIIRCEKQCDKCKV